MPKDSRIHLRLDPTERDKLQKVCDFTGLDEPTALRACVNALIEYIETHGEIRLPLAVIPKSKAATQPAAATDAPSARKRTGPTDNPHGLNEPPAGYVEPDQLPPSKQRMTRSRAALRTMTEREKKSPKP